MPLRDDIHSVLLPTSGPIVIGQACEFDYSGVQAARALRSKGIRVVLIGPNPASILTDPSVADATYIETLDVDTAARIIQKEKVDAILPTMGGQTALNLTVDLHKAGHLEHVKVLGISIEGICKTEDRSIFRQLMTEHGLDVPLSKTVDALQEAYEFLEEIGGLPVVIRPSFTLGGAGGGFAYTKEQFGQIVAGGLRMSPVGQVLIEQSMYGWKEYELEVMRDYNDCCISVCSIENVDPVGIHTGDSVTVAPAMTLTDKEYQNMRSQAFKVIRAVGLQAGGANVQFAVHPVTGRCCVIEANPRVSRSSALASKATGYPIASVAALLSIGYTLDELRNTMIGTIPSSFEPSLDYVVVKVPGFAFEKFPTSPRTLTTTMHSIGEVMAIGSNFPQALQKALEGLNIDLGGLEMSHKDDGESWQDYLSARSPDTLRRVARAIYMSIPVEEIVSYTHIDRWFIDQIALVIEARRWLEKHGLPVAEDDWYMVKSLGFSDEHIAKVTGVQEQNVRKARWAAGVYPRLRSVDTCAGEFHGQMQYLYLSYGRYQRKHFFAQGAMAQSSWLEKDARKIIVLGSGPNRIAQGIEFDYCCVHAVCSFIKRGYSTVMINCNPETVSTDYNVAELAGIGTSAEHCRHVLYFEPLTTETLLEVMRIEGCVGIVTQMGGQTPLRIIQKAREQAQDLPLLGTDISSMELTENRQLFQELCQRLGIVQPKGRTVTNHQQLEDAIEELGYPFLCRPSYVIGGRSMHVITGPAQAKAILGDVRIKPNAPLLLDQYIQNAMELDVDCLSDALGVYIAGITEHVESAGVHSGDSSCVFPPQHLSGKCVREIEGISAKLAKHLSIKGWFNIQCVVRDEIVYVIECNPRASRTVPFLSKARGVNFNEYACALMLGNSLQSCDLQSVKDAKKCDYTFVKTSVFPFTRFAGTDTTLGPEMRSTGEVMGIGRDVYAAFINAQLSAGIRLPERGNILMSLCDEDKGILHKLAEKLSEMKYKIFATVGTYQRLLREGMEGIEMVHKVWQLPVGDGSMDVVQAIYGGEISLVFNTPSPDKLKSLHDGYKIRRAALDMSVPCYTNIEAIRLVVDALQNGTLETIRDRIPLSLQELHG